MRTKKEPAAKPEKRGEAVSAAAEDTRTAEARMTSTEPAPETAKRAAGTVGPEAPGAPKRAERPEPPEPEELRALLAAATPDACRLIWDTINDEDAKLELRIKCCEIVLDRVYGKAGQSLGLDARGVAPVLFLGGELVAD